MESNTFTRKKSINPDAIPGMLRPRSRSSCSFARKHRIAKQANYRCALCDICVALLPMVKYRHGEYISPFAADHIIPITIGGKNNRKNLRILCHDCHQEQTNEYMEWKRLYMYSEECYNAEVIDFEYIEVSIQFDWAYVDWMARSYPIGELTGLLALGMAQWNFKI